MQKNPLIPIDEGPLDIWYESPSVMAVKKPKGLKVHPSNPTESGTLLNRLFQENRWLADMETSETAGVLHVFEENDHGLMLFNKNDDYKEVITNSLRNNEVHFSYFITIKGHIDIQQPKPETFHMNRFHVKQVAGDYTIIDITTTTGNTRDIRNLFATNQKIADLTFYCYQIELILPHSGEHHVLSLRDTSKEYPNVVLYHAPP